MSMNFTKEVDLTETKSHYVRPMPEHLDHGTDDEPFNPMQSASTKNRTSQPINHERLQPMQTGTFLTIYGDWSLYVSFSVAEIAAGNKANKPLSGFHPYDWEILQGDKKLAYGTAPCASKNGVIPYGITDSELARLLVALGADRFQFKSRVNMDSLPDVYTLMGWNAAGEGLSKEQAEKLDADALAVAAAALKPTTVTRRKAAK